MASICTSCLRALRTQARRELHHLPRPQRERLPPIQTRPLSSTPTRLAEEQPQNQPSPPSHPYRDSTSPSTDTLKNFASTVRNAPGLKQTTEPYVAYGTTRSLLATCQSQITYTIPSAVSDPPATAPQNAAGEDLGEGSGWWFLPRSQGGLGLDATFGNWAQVMMLYLYCLTARLRCFPPEHAKVWQQQLLDHFFYACEDRMVVWHRIDTRGTRNKYLKDLWQQWRGVLLSYDEGLIKGDAVLAGAVWRNVFKGEEGVDLEDLAMVTAYLRGQLKMLDGLNDVEVSEGRVEFQEPRKYRSMVGRESPMLKKEFSNEEVGAVKARVENDVAA